MSTKTQITDRQQTYIDHGVSGARANRPQLDAALNDLHDGDTLVVTTFDRLGRSTANLLALPDQLTQRGAALRVLNLGGHNVDTRTSMGSMMFSRLVLIATRKEETNETIGTISP